MYYYPKIPKSFSPAPFSHKIYNNVPIEKMFHSSMTPEPSPHNQRKRSFSIAARGEIRSYSTTRPLQQIGRDKCSSSHNVSPSKFNHSLNKVTIYHIDNGNTRNTATHHVSLNISFEDYFQKIYFRKLSGVVSKQLYEKLEPYIKQIVLLNEQNLGIQDNWIPTQYKGITTKEKFLASIKKLQKINRRQFIRELIVYYCIPPESLRKQLLSNIIADIHVKFKQKAFMDYSFPSYCLVNIKGKIISDVLKIPLISKQFLFCCQNSWRQNYQRFKQIKNKTLHQSTLFDVVKKTFIERVKKVDEQYKPQKVRIFQKKMEKESISLVSRRRKILPEQRHMKTKKDERTVTIAKIKDQYEISTKEATMFVDQLYVLLDKNGRYTDSEKVSSTNKRLSAISINNFRDNCVSLQGKEKQNVDKILQCMQISKQKQTISIDQYVQFRLVVQCLAEPSKVLGFLMRFLTLDKQKQLTRQMFSEALKITLREYRIPRSNRVIIDILWLQLKRSNLIEYVNDEEYLTINRFKENYLINKTLYYFLSTIIFCTNDPVQTAYDVL